MKSKEGRYNRIFGAYEIRGVAWEDLDNPIMMELTLTQSIASQYRSDNEVPFK